MPGKFIWLYLDSESLVNMNRWIYNNKIKYALVPPYGHLHLTLYNHGYNIQPIFKKLSKPIIITPDNISYYNALGKFSIKIHSNKIKNMIINTYKKVPNININTIPILPHIMVSQKSCYKPLTRIDFNLRFIGINTSDRMITRADIKEIIIKKKKY